MDPICLIFLCYLVQFSYFSSINLYITVNRRIKPSFKTTSNTSCVNKTYTRRAPSFFYHHRTFIITVLLLFLLPLDKWSLRALFPHEKRRRSYHAALPLLTGPARAGPARPPPPGAAVVGALRGGPASRQSFRCLSPASHAPGLSP